MAIESREMFILNTMNTLTNFCIGAITVVACIFGTVATGTGSFNQHIILCVLGYVLLMSQAVMIFNNANGWSQALSYEDRKTAHWVIQIAGSSLAIAGSIIRILGYEGNQFSTPHGVLGLLAMIFTMLTFFGGIVNLYARKQAKQVKIGHAASGILTLTFALITLCFGMDKAIFRAYVTNSGANTLIAFTAFLFIGVLSSACVGGVYRRIIK